MDDWVWWMIAAGVLAVGEIATVSFFLGPIAVACVLAAVVAALGVGLPVQWIVFILASLGSLAVLRPIARRHLRTPAQLRTGTAALVGRTAMVLERISNDDGTGCVKLEGETWTARAYDEDDVIEPGKRVQVMEIRGATALVTEE
jgi:membrane protein implicated in regulation of membrane protease activity